jgi:hypothetical protein
MSGGANVKALDVNQCSALVHAHTSHHSAVSAALIEHKASLTSEMDSALRFAWQRRDKYPRAFILRWASEAGDSFAAQARCARDQHVASHWTDSPLFDWHLVREITQYIAYAAAPQAAKKKQK